MAELALKELCDKRKRDERHQAELVTAWFVPYEGPKDELNSLLAPVGRHLARAEPNAALLGSLATLARPGADQLALELG